MMGPYTRQGATAITLALEYQMFKFACDSGLQGVTIQVRLARSRLMDPR